MRKNIVILCDHKWRDLPGIVLLREAIKALDHSVTVSIIVRNHIFDYLENHRVDQIVLASSNSPWLLHVALFHSKGIQVLILPTEGRPNYGKMLEWSLTRHEGEAADGILLWSERMEKAFLEAKDPSAKQHFVAGPIRFDFYHQSLQEIFMEKEELYRVANLSTSFPFVSISSVFPHAKHYSSEAWQIQDWQAMGFEKLIPSEENSLQKKIQSEYENRGRLLDLVVKMARRFPTIAFIVKCHPFEDVEWWEDAVKGFDLPNFRFVKGIYIGDLLRWTSLHLHRSCTTGTEAWIFNKPTIELDMIDDYFGDVMRGSGENKGAVEDAAISDEHVEDEETLADRIQHYVIQAAKVPEHYEIGRSAYLRKWFFLLDGKASERAARYIVTMNRASTYSGWAPGAPHFWATLGKNFARLRFLLVITAKLRFDLLRKELWIRSTKAEKNMHWDKDITRKDVDEWTKRIKKILKK